MLRLGLLADVHMGEGDEAAVERALERAVERVRAFDPHRTVVLGDLIEDVDRETDRENVERVVDALAPLDPRYLAGNHDADQLDAGELAALFGNDLSGRETVQGVDLVYLDTAAPHLPRSRAEVGDEQLAMLDEVLAASEEALVFAHHPVHYRDVTHNPWFGEHPELAFAADKAWIQRTFDDHGGVLATFNGHLHDPHHAVYRGADHFTLNAFNKEHPESTAVTGSHALVTLDDRLRVELYDADGFVREWAVPR